MLRIVGVQRSDNVAEEFVLLQNQGSLRTVLRGHLVLAEKAIEKADLREHAHLFVDDESIHPGLFVMLTTGSGPSHWTRSRDGTHVFHAYAGRASTLWNGCDGPFHVLSPCHSYCERSETLLLR